MMDGMAGSLTQEFSMAPSQADLELVAFDIHAFVPPDDGVGVPEYQAALAADDTLRQLLETDSTDVSALHEAESMALVTLLQYRRARLLDAAAS